MERRIEPSTPQYATREGARAKLNTLDKRRIERNKRRKREREERNRFSRREREMHIIVMIMIPCRRTVDEVMS